MFARITITEGAPSLRSLQEPALSCQSPERSRGGVEGVGGDAADITCVVRDVNRSTPALRKVREDGASTGWMTPDARETKNASHNPLERPRARG
jgi:hypothetical protein